MAKLIYLFLLISYVVFAQGTGNYSFIDENVENQTLHREKRLVHSVLHGRPHKVPYIVFVLKNSQYHCIGIILTPAIILTSAKCIYDDNGTYSVMVPKTASGESITHTVNRKKIYTPFNPRSNENDIGLLMIHPAIVERNFVSRIPLYNGSLPIDSTVIFTGWGYVIPTLRSVALQTIGIEVCRKDYRSSRVITEKDLCAADSEGHGKGVLADLGGPLVFAGKLVGIYSWTGEREGRPSPDVFMNLQHRLYKSWILESMREHHGRIFV